MLNTGADDEPIVAVGLFNAIVFTNCIHNCHSSGLNPFKLSHSHYYPLSRARVPCRYFACDVILAHSECSISDLLGIANVAEGPPQLLHSDSDSQSSHSKETKLEARLLEHWLAVCENAHIIYSYGGSRRRVFFDRLIHLSCFHCFTDRREGIHVVAVAAYSAHPNN